MQAAAARASHHEHRRVGVRCRRRRIGRGAEGLGREHLVNHADALARHAVVGAHAQAHHDHGGGDRHRHPAALEELLRHRHGQDAARDQQAGGRQQQARAGAAFGAVLYPVAAQAGQRQAESEEHVNAVQNHQQIDFTAGPQQRGGGGHPHEQHAVLGHQTGRQVAELVRHPRVGGHVSQHRRPAQEARVGGHQQQAGLEGEGGGQGAAQARAGQAQVAENGVEHHRVQGLASHWTSVPQQVQQDDAAGGEGQADRHVQHGQFAGAYARLGQRIDVVRHRLDAGVGAAAERIGLE